VLEGQAVRLLHVEVMDEPREPAGEADVAPRRFSVVFAKKMKPEGITRGTIGGRSALVIVDDGGGFQVIWEDKPLPYARAF